VFAALTKSSLKVIEDLAPSKEFFDDREKVRARLEGVVRGCSALPKMTKILVFGSSNNGFGSFKSDLDMCIR